jgi:hypothetical protein
LFAHGLEDPVIEVEPVHLRAKQVVVDLLGQGPARGIDLREPYPEPVEPAVLRGHRRPAVVRDAVRDRRLLEGAPVGEQRDQVLVAGRLLRDGSGGRARARGEDERDRRPQAQRLEGMHSMGSGG